MTTSSKVRSRRRRACFAVIACLLAIPTTTLAQPAQPAQPGPSAGDLESARELFKEGREARQSGDLRRALDRFKAAHAYGQTPVTGLELGRTHVQLGELVEGREVLLSVARIKVQSDETEKSGAARTEAADLAEEVKKRIPTVSVNLSGIAADASVQLTIDGAVVPVVGLTGIRKTNPGKHVIVARAGSREETRTIDLAEGKSQDVAISLAGREAPVSPANVQSELKPSGRSIGTVTWVGLGVGGAGIVVGTIGGIIALGKKSAVDKACSGIHCPVGTKDDVSAGRTAAAISTVGFAIGAAGVITAAVGYFVLSRPSTPAGAQLGIAPFVTANAFGIDVIGSRF